VAADTETLKDAGRKLTREQFPLIILLRKRETARH
jgi:hypothetical protein